MVTSVAHLLSQHLVPTTYNIVWFPDPSTENLAHAFNACLYVRGRVWEPDYIIIIVLLREDADTIPTLTLSTCL